MFLGGRGGHLAGSTLCSAHSTWTASGGTTLNQLLGTPVLLWNGPWQNPWHTLNAHKTHNSFGTFLAVEKSSEQIATQKVQSPDRVWRSSLIWTMVQGRFLFFENHGSGSLLVLWFFRTVGQGSIPVLGGTRIITWFLTRISQWEPIDTVMCENQSLLLTWTRIGHENQLLSLLFLKERDMFSRRTSLFKLLLMWKMKGCCWTKGWKGQEFRHFWNDIQHKWANNRIGQYRGFDFQALSSGC